MKKFIGKRVFEGIVINNIIRYDESIFIENKNVRTYEEELSRFNTARKQVIDDYKLIYKNADNKQNNNIILSFIAILEDLDLIDTVNDLFQKEHINAEEAVYKTCSILKEMLSNIDNDYLKERTNDIEEVCKKIINKLQNKQEFIINTPSIIISNNISVSTLLQMDKKNIKGLVLQNISPNAHISILAKSFAIPCIASVNEDIKIIPNEKVILDSTSGLLIVSPSLKDIAEYEQEIQRNIQFNKDLLLYKNKIIKTIDNKFIKVYANISSSLETQMAIDNSADGIGLFRTEFIFLNSTTLPTENEQFEHYKRCVSLMKDKPTIIRTIDIGADKQVSFINIPQENNPALGYRGVRLYNENKDIFIIQLQALLRASIYGSLKIMIPMITNVEEIRFVKACLQEAKDNLTQRNIPYDEKLKVGIMIETPASAIICDELAKYVDFFSIGTNDLTQYVLAIDRENSKVLNTLNYHHKALLRLIQYISNIAKQNNIEVGICGELARDKELLGFFIKCQIDEISVSSSYVLQCKKNITEINTTEINMSEYV